MYTLIPKACREIEIESERKFKYPIEQFGKPGQKRNSKSNQTRIKYLMKNRSIRSEEIHININNKQSKQSVSEAALADLTPNHHRLLI